VKSTDFDNDEMSNLFARSGAALERRASFRNNCELNDLSGYFENESWCSPQKKSQGRPICSNLITQFIEIFSEYSLDNLGSGRKISFPALPFDLTTFVQPA
jgi:hypothetical protein